MDYDFSTLGTEGFERMAQSLCVAALGTAVKPLGVGRDGGRDLYFRGKVDYSRQSGSWCGYGVVQVKHRAREGSRNDNTKWVKAQITGELALWARGHHGEAPKRKELPNYYLLVTGATLSPEGQDECLFHLQELCHDLGIVDCDIWSRTEVSRLLDNHDSIRRTYLHLVLPGDIVAALATSYGDAEVDLAKQLSVGAAVDLSDRQWARLGDSGLESEERLQLTSVAVDLPCSGSTDEEGEAENPTANLQRAIELGECDLRPTSSRPAAGLLLKGGPGQGKSTAAQLLCQVYRTSFIRHSSVLTARQHKLVADMEAAATRLALPRTSASFI